MAVSTSATSSRMSLIRSAASGSGMSMSGSARTGRPKARWNSATIWTGDNGVITGPAAVGCPQSGCFPWLDSRLLCATRNQPGSFWGGLALLAAGLIQPPALLVGQIKPMEYLAGLWVSDLFWPQTTARAAVATCSYIR
jgi:hypothetical protein